MFGRKASRMSFGVGRTVGVGGGTGTTSPQFESLVVLDMFTRLLHVGLGGLLRFAMAFVLVGFEAFIRITYFLTPNVRPLLPPSSPPFPSSPSLPPPLDPN